MKNIIYLIALITTLTSCINNNKEHNNHDSPLKKTMHSMSTGMDNMKMTKDPDHDFAMMMKMHHLGAVDMATYELANGKDNVIKAKAQMMKDAQTMEIIQLDSFMNAHSVLPDSMAGMAFMEASELAMNKMSNLAQDQKLNGNIDYDFVQLMIQHHQSAIEMANAQIQFGKVQKVKDMATKMKTDQMKEIAELKTWLKSKD
jgi:uncharacterized protein (DUF305 family)